MIMVFSLSVSFSTLLLHSYFNMGRGKSERPGCKALGLQGQDCSIHLGWPLGQTLYCCTWRKNSSLCEQSNLREPCQWHSTGCVVSVKLLVNTNICRRELQQASIFTKAWKVDCSFILLLLNILSWMCFLSSTVKVCWRVLNIRVMLQLLILLIHEFPACSGMPQVSSAELLGQLYLWDTF